MWAHGKKSIEILIEIQKSVYIKWKAFENIVIAWAILHKCNDHEHLISVHGHRNTRVVTMPTLSSLAIPQCVCVCVWFKTHCRLFLTFCKHFKNHVHVIHIRVTSRNESVVWNTECSPERSVVVGWLAPAECMCWDCAGASLETGSFEGQALSSGPGARTGWTYAAEKLIARCVFWQSCVRLVIVCRGSVWRDSVLRYRLWVVRPVTTSSGVFVCDRENCIGRTKAGCQRWVGNCVERRGEVLHQWWQRFTNLASPLDIYLHRCGGHLKTLRPVALRQVLLFLLANHRRPFKRPRVRTVWPRFPDSRHLIGWKEVTERLLYFVYKMTMILTAQLWGSCDALTSRFLLWK